MEQKPSPHRYYQILRNFREAELLYAALTMDFFSHLETATTAVELAATFTVPPNAMAAVLDALFVCDFLEKDNDSFVNTVESNTFLSRHSPLYLGESLLFRNSLSSLATLATDLKSPTQKNFYDFITMAKASIPEMYATGRVDDFIFELTKMYPNSTNCLSILDLGGGSGILGIEAAKRYASAKITIFEMATVLPITQNEIAKAGLEKRVSLLSGNFLVDDISGPYHLVIASGILDFTNNNPSFLLQKIAASLYPDAYLLLILAPNHQKQQGVPDNILGWLSSYIQGQPRPAKTEQVETLLAHNGFTFVRTSPQGMFEGRLYKKEKCNDSFT